MTRWYQSVGFLLLLFALNPSLAIADPLCWLRSSSAVDATIKGPLELGPDWKVFKLTKPFKAAPFVQYVHLLLKRADFKFVNLTDPDEHPETLNRWVPRNLSTGQVQLFEVRVRNNKLGWVNLDYSSTSYPPANDNAFVAIGFSSPFNENRFFYPQNSVIEEVHIRANHKVLIEEMRWQADGYWKWPCRKWSEVPASEIMIPER